jgi:TatD DNase family protein
MIFDTHCHGYWKELIDRQTEVQENMRLAGVTRSVQIGADWESSCQALALARNWGSTTWCTVGIHPTDCQGAYESTAEQSVERLELLVRQNRDKVVGIGETGLDFFHLTPGKEEDQKQVQQDFFRAQAALALRMDLPLIIHTRDAAADIIKLIKETGTKRAIIHCFSEDLEFAQELLSWSDEIYFSFSGILTYKKALAVQTTARTLRLDRILVETDAPFLVPQAVRATYSINEPAFTRYVMDFLKTLREEPAELIEQTVWDNSNRVFRISD